MNKKPAQRDFQSPENKIAMTAMHENRFTSANAMPREENTSAKAEVKPK